MKQSYSDPLRSINICVDGYENKRITGVIQSTSQNKTILFQSTIEMLLGIESLLTDQPQPFSAKRTFRPGMDKENGFIVAAGPKNGSLATFTLRILFRQNASWQGTVLWQEGKTEESFRSVLELIYLMDSALSGSNTSQHQE